MSYNNLFATNEDGASAAAKAVRAYLSALEGIESSWDGKLGHYKAQPSIDRWSNCREQGYVIKLVAPTRLREPTRQINLIFCENRNSDDIICYEVETSLLLNPLTLHEMDESKGHFNWAHSERYDGATRMADWIFERLTAFWDEVTAETVPPTQKRIAAA